MTLTLTVVPLLSAGAGVGVPTAAAAATLVVAVHSVAVTTHEVLESFEVLHPCHVPSRLLYILKQPLGAVAAAAGLDMESMITGAAHATAPATPAALIMSRRLGPRRPPSAVGSGPCEGEATATNLPLSSLTGPG